jgi:hypothetical protein
MIIKNKNQAGLNFTEFQKQRLIKERFGSIDSLNIDENLKRTSKDRLMKTIEADGSKFYLLTKTVLDLASRVKIDLNNFDYKFLDTITENKITFLLGDRFYRWTKTEGKINVLCVEQQEIPDYMKGAYPIGTTHDISYVFFSFDTHYGALSFPNNAVKPFSEETALEFLQLLVFTELSPIETKSIFPNQSTGTRRAGKYTNDSNSKVIIVDSTWNLNIVITGAFIVSGFFRMQPFGENNSKRKLIWISSFKKNGYTRGAKKINH